MGVALDFAIQCSPDHPWVKQHPDWFKQRPDGTIKYAENPPKKYEDIVNVDFYAKDAVPGLWLALRDVVSGQGVVLADGVARAKGPYPHPNNLALYLDRVAPMAVAVAIVDQGKRRLMTPVAGILLVGLALTLSRGAALAAFVARNNGRTSPASHRDFRFVIRRVKPMSAQKQAPRFAI